MNRINFKYWKKILILQFYEQFWRNGTRMAIRKNFKLSKYEDITYDFKACGLEISNIELLSQNIQISRFYEHFKKFHEICFCSYFREICFCSIFAKFEYLTLQRFIVNIWSVSRLFPQGIPHVY